VNDAFPGGILADEILTPGPKQVRALFVTGGNPLITMANAGRLAKAFESLELLVVLDILPTETASLAHYVLPCTAPIQRPDLPFIFPLMLGLQSKPYLQATRPILPPDGEQRDEATIYLDLARRRGSFSAPAWCSGRSGGDGCTPRAGPAAAGIPQELPFPLLLPLRKRGCAVAREPHGVCATIANRFPNGAS
jgi:anaerobic selenocysteine-containing dehydrogenase